MMFRTFPARAALSAIVPAAAHPAPAQGLRSIQRIIDVGFPGASEPMIDGLRSPHALVVSPDGRHLYAVSSLDDSRWAFARAAADGRLTPMQNLLDNTAGVDAKHVYVAARSVDTLSGFSRDATSGLLTPIQTLQNGIGIVSALGGAKDVAISPDGTNVYVASELDSVVAQFSRNTERGMLAFIGAPVDGQGSDGLRNACRLTIAGKRG